MGKGKTGKRKLKGAKREGRSREEGEDRRTFEAVAKKYYKLCYIL